MRDVKQFIKTEDGVYEKRHLHALIRRKMMSKTFKSKKDYTRKLKHKNKEP